MWINYRRLLPTKKVVSRVVLTVVMISSMIIAQFGVPTHVNAVGTLTTPRIYLSRQNTNLSSGVTMQIFFTTVGTVTSGGKLVIAFPNDTADNGKWCRAAGADLVATGKTNPDGATETATALTSSSSFTTSCSSTPDTFTITNVAALSATTKYGVQIAQAGSPTALIGTGNGAQTYYPVITTQTGASTPVDTQTTGITLVANDQVSVTATVTPTLTVSLSGNSIPLGTLDSTHINYVGITSTVSANGTGGYVSVVNYNNTLTDLTSDTIADAGGSLAVGVAGYGASTSSASGGLGIAASTVYSPACDVTPRQIAAGTPAATSLTTAFKSYASSASPVSGDVTTLCFGAAVAYNTKPGSYTSTSTVVTTGRF